MVIERALIFLAPIALAAVLITIAVIEIKETAHAPSSSGSVRKAAPVSGRAAASCTFRRPAKGSRYYLSHSTSVWIRPVSRNFYKIYYICGDKPSVPLMKDNYGFYFAVRAKTLWEAEDRVRKAYS